jgi:hypothetical protein
MVFDRIVGTHDGIDVLASMAGAFSSHSGVVAGAGNASMP